MRPKFGRADYKAVRKHREENKKTKPLKKCGHEYGYKCSCRGGENDGKVFDTVDEMKLRPWGAY